MSKALCDYPHQVLELYNSLVFYMDRGQYDHAKAVLNVMYALAPDIVETMNADPEILHVLCELRKRRPVKTAECKCCGMGIQCAHSGHVDHTV